MNRVIAALAMAASLGCASPCLAQQEPVATATFHGASAAAGVGYVWGEGVLTFKAKTYPFLVQGLSAVGVGGETFSGTAQIYHLRSVDDFPGLYAGVGAGGAAGGLGGGTAVLVNRHGVEMRVQTRERGLQLNIAVSGLGLSWPANRHR